MTMPTPPAPPCYRDLEILIGDWQGSGYPVHVITSPAGEGEGLFTLPFAGDELQDALARMEREASNEAFLADFGARLFTSLFSGDVRARYAESVGLASADAGLRIRLRLDPPELQELPWELLRDPEKREFLVLSKRSLVTRYLHVPRPTPPLEIEPPLRVLVVVAAPQDQVLLNGEDEVARIRQALRPLLDKGVVNLLAEPHGSKRSLRRRLLDDAPHVLHYVGHGGLTGDRGLLILEDGQGGADVLDGPTLGTLLKGSSVRLVVLNACLTGQARKPAPTHTAGQARKPAPTLRAAFMGVGPALVDAGLGAVVAMQFSIYDASARVFAEDFYSMLAHFKPVDECVSRAREALLLEVGLDRRDWATPVLFMRAPDGCLFAGQAAETRPMRRGPFGRPRDGGCEQSLESSVSHEQSLASSVSHEQSLASSGDYEQSPASSGGHEQSTSSAVGAYSPAAPTLTAAQRRRLEQRRDELQGPLATYNRRIVALEGDLARELDGERRAILEERLDRAKQAQDKALAEIEEIERKLGAG